MKGNDFGVIWALFLILNFLIDFTFCFPMSTNMKTFSYRHKFQSLVKNISNHHILKIRNFRSSLSVVEDLDQVYPCFSTEWDSHMKQLATDALVPVFYPIVNQNLRLKSYSNLSNISSGEIDAEKALKKLLSRYQKSLSLNHNLTERQESRKMLAELVLGTSVWRIKYYHQIIAYLQAGKNPSKSFDSTLSMDNLEPIDGVITEYCPKRMNGTNESHRVAVVRAMVDMHFERSNQNDFDEECQNHDHQMMQLESISEKISIQYSLPSFFTQMLVDQYGEDTTEALANVFNQPGPVTIRRNKIKCPSDSQLCTRLYNDHGITTEIIDDGCLRFVKNDAWSPSTTSIWSLQTWKDGWFEVQDMGSQAIVKACEVDHNDEVVIDFCCGNGGKTLALASELFDTRSHNLTSLLENGKKSVIIAHDIVEDRLKQLQGSFSRIGLELDGTCSKVEIHPALDINVSLKADLVLVDAPCSSTGVLRRRPSQRFKLDQNEIHNEFPKLQLSLLEEASKFVKIGGKLLYSTCSISHFENQDVVKAFEDTPGFSTKWGRWNFSPNKGDNCGSNMQILLPSRNGSDGFFIARWKRLN